MSSASTRTLTDDPLGGTVCRTVLPSGLRVVTESIPAMRGAAVGVWVATGSRDETAQLSGASHFLEHLLFKGTSRRSALDISAQIEAVGGETNAFTAKEYTCYFARVLDTDVPLAVDVLGDVITDSLLCEEDIETERRVILEEIAMQRDEPADDVHDLFASAVFDGHPLARDIAGTPESVSRLNREDIFAFYRRHYVAPAMSVVAAGSLDHDQVVKTVQDSFGRLLDGQADPCGLRQETALVNDIGSRVVVAQRDSEQAHLVLGCRSLARRDERRFALEVLGNVLGGGMSSRLFYRIREEAGLAYSVFSYTSEFADTGMFAVYAGCNPQHIHRVLELINTVLAEVARNGISEQELSRGKGMAKGALVLAMEDTGSRMHRLGLGEMQFGNQFTVDETLERIDKVTVDDVAAVATDVLNRPMSLAVSGPFDASEFSL